ncbi:hypothetical protein B0T25DRAFT_461040 [Lasiosphaeria hispida]|uniref:Fe2OG dioxygenase domain-containing protein n=1 Tax=Lasiosphaeria hispida TaxID=260671 RepID=A0AAJ0HBE1_9PEZI|nr:hypothetical protein B0T25DRAFT_461040 [Lasiosphaeria hispida]
MEQKFKKSDLLDALEAIKVSGSFASFSNMAGVSCNPSIFVRGIGMIKTPLAEDQARQLIRQARQAPYGRRCDTIVDTSVRNTWELDATQFEFLNPHWTTTLKTCCKTVARGLGITSPVSAELYKMLVYEKGAMFKAHTDTEKIPGMFGTLVICLPSPHEGGDLVLKHRGEKKVFKTSEIQPSLACWYSDVLHEVLPVTSGYRWVLTYNLAVSPELPRPSAGLVRDENRVLRHTLRRWLEQRKRHGAGDQAEADHFYYLLDHEYTEASISLRGLKTTDLARLQCLRAISAELEFDVFLAVLEKEEMGETAYDYNDYRGRGGYGWYDEDEDEDGNKSWHELDEVLDRSASILKLVDLDGHTLRTDMPIDGAHICDSTLQNEDPFEDPSDQGERDYEPYMGNSGPSATHWYRTTVAVLVARDAVNTFLLGGSTLRSSEAQTLLQYYAKQCLEPKTRATGLQMIRRLAPLAWKPPQYYAQTPSQNRAIVLTILETILQLHEYALFGDVLAILRHLKDDDDACAGLFTLINAAAGIGSLQFERIDNSLLECLTSRPVGNWKQPMTVLCPVPGSDIEVWAATEVVKVCLQTCQKTGVGERDGVAAVFLIRQYQDWDYLKANLLPILNEKVAASGFMLGALQEMVKYAAEGVFNLAECLQTYKKLAKQIVNTLNIAEDKSVFSPVRLSPVRLADFFGDCIRFGWDDISAHLGLNIASQATRIPAPQLGGFWIPFIEHLLQTLKDADVPLSTPRYQDIACAIFEVFLDKFVGKEPTPNTSLRRPRVDCSCSDCVWLNEFLESSDQSVGNFPVAKARRRHLHNMLDGVHADVTHLTERHGSPYTLVVTKTFKENEIAKKKWSKRFDAAKQVFAKLGEVQLRALLGDEYDKITGMEHLRLRYRSRASLVSKQAQSEVSRTQPVLGSQQQQARVLAPLLMSQSGLQQNAGQPGSSMGLPGVGALGFGGAAGALPQVAGTKRKAQTQRVDLTEDSE